MKKRIISLLMASALVVSLVACGSEGGNQTNTQNTESSQNTENSQQDQDTQADVDTEQESQADSQAPSDNTAEGTIGQILVSDFMEKEAANPEMTCEDLANALLENSVIEFAGATMPVEEGYLNGFTEEIHGFDEGVMFSPMIGSIPFVGYVFTVSEGIEDFMETLKNAADPRWNICTQADEMQVQAVNDKVFFVMCSNEEE